MKKLTINKITKITVDIFFYAGIACVIGVPFLGKILQTKYNFNLSTFMTIILFTSGVFAVCILYNFRCMIKTLVGGNPFVWDNIKYFNRTAASCVIIALIYIIKCFVIFSPATITIICVFAIASLFCLTLKDIFKKAIEYKEENDWTV